MGGTRSGYARDNDKPSADQITRRCARAIADLYARFPRLRIVFCANRKIAETWTRNYFAAVSAIGNALSVEAESAMQNDDDVEAVAE